MGAHEIRMQLGGTSRQRVYQLTSRADFPSPVADLRSGKVWLAEDVEAWILRRTGTARTCEVRTPRPRQRRRRPGRP